MSTNNVSVTPELLVVEPVGLNKLWSLTRRLQIPLEHVHGATFDPDTIHKPQGWRGPGLGLPGRRSGTYHTGKKQQYWNTSGHDRTVVVTLGPEERYERLVITVDDPHRVVTAINSAIATR